MKLPRYTFTVLLALAVLVLALPLDAIYNVGGTLYLAFIVPVVGIWAVYSFLRLLAKPAERKERGIRLAIVVPALVLAVISMQFQDTNALVAASAAINAVSDFKRRTGAYPKGLTEVGLDGAALRSKFSLVYRVQSDGKAFLFYSQPSMPLVAHHYDFQAAKWERSD